MLNQIVLVGRLVQDPEIKELENGNRLCYINLAVPRSWKNADGIYETDFIPCKVGYPKGRIQTKQEENKNIIEIVAEKVTFLSSRKETEEE